MSFIIWNNLKKILEQTYFVKLPDYQRVIQKIHPNATKKQNETKQNRTLRPGKGLYK